MSSSPHDDKKAADGRRALHLALLALGAGFVAMLAPTLLRGAPTL